MFFHIPSELRHATQYVRLNTRLCKACWECIAVCPEDVIVRINLPFHRHAVIENSFRCKGCLKCAAACQSQAITPLPRISHENQEVSR